MRKNLKLVGIMLLSGVLTAGIGCGIAFAEYSSFSYGGKQVLEGSEYYTKTISYTVPIEAAKKAETEENLQEAEDNEVVDTEATEKSSEKPTLRLNVYHGYSLEYDTSIPKDVFRVRVDYLTDDTSLTPVINEIDAVNHLYLDCGFEYDEFRDFMRAKDTILKDIKNGVISELQPDSVHVTICLHPEAEFNLTPIYY